MSEQCSNPQCTSRDTKSCGHCKTISYCSRWCQEAHWAAHRLHCNTWTFGPPSYTVKAVKLVAATSGPGHSTYQEILLDPGHPIFNTMPVAISQAFAFPLVIWMQQSEGRGNNQHGTWLMIDPKTCFAPEEWQSRIGDMLVAKPDKEPLTTDTLSAIMRYVLDILLSAEDGRVVVEGFYNRDRLDKHVANHPKLAEECRYCEDQILHGTDLSVD